MKIQDMRIGQIVLVHAQDWSLERAEVIGLSVRHGREDVTIKCEYGIFDGFYAHDFIDNGQPPAQATDPAQTKDATPITP